MSTIVQVRWVGGSSNIQVDISLLLNSNIWLARALLFYMNQNYNIYFSQPLHFHQVGTYYQFWVGRWSVFKCPCGQMVGSQLNAHVCPLGVGG